MKRLLAAASFAAGKHTTQRRKNLAATPYINHPLEVAEHLARVGGIDDEEILVAALLHDTLEDTLTTPDEIRELFGDRVTRMVLECTDDKSLEKQERKRLQIVHAPHKSPEAKCIKLADKTNNLNSMLLDPPRDWDQQRQLEYFEWAEKVIQGLLGVNRDLDLAAQQVLKVGLAALRKNWAGTELGRKP